MTLFLIYCIPCSIIGLFLGGMFACGARTKVGRVVTLLATTIIFTVIFAGGFTLEAHGDEKAWNNGICSCGGEFHFTNATKQKNLTYYYYECDTCGYVLETHGQKTKKGG